MILWLKSGLISGEFMDTSVLLEFFIIFATIKKWFAIAWFPSLS